MRLSRATIYALIAVLVVGLVGSGLASGAENKVKVKTKVTMKLVGSDYGDKFTGKVKAKPKNVSGKAKKKFKKKCKKKRKVTVFQKVAGGKERVGADKTNKKGKWSVNVGGLADPGRYFAQAKKKNVKVGSAKGVCKKGKSKKVTVS
jgi:hypothetical protein